MKVKIAELEGAALDWAVFAALHSPMEPAIKRVEAPEGFPCPLYVEYTDATREKVVFSPSFDWSQGGPLIETHGIGVIFIGGLEGQNCWQVPTYSLQETHQKPLVIAMRALVAAKLGAEVEIPGELAQ